MARTNDYSSDHAIAGATSGFVTRFACQPLDVIKIRFQLQVEPVTNCSQSKYHSVVQAFFLIFKEEGVSAFWKGHVPAQILSIVYGVGQFYSYNMFMKASDNFALAQEWKYSRKFLAGAAAGTVATTISFPFDTVRTRLVAQSSKHKVYKGFFDSLRCILQHETPKTFFKGLSPTLIQIIPHTGLQFAFYGFFCDIYKKYSKETERTFINSMISGCAAGLIAKTVIYPLDLTRKRLQIQGFKEGRKGFGTFCYCSGLIDCLRITFKTEGVKGLFKGLVPSQLKAAVTTALHFTTYEQSLVAIKMVRSYILKQ